MQYLYLYLMFKSEHFFFLSPTLLVSSLSVCHYFFCPSIKSLTYIDNVGYSNFFDLGADRDNVFLFGTEGVHAKQQYVVYI